MLSDANRARGGLAIWPGPTTTVTSFTTTFFSARRTSGAQRPSAGSFSANMAAITPPSISKSQPVMKPASDRAQVRRHRDLFGGAMRLAGETATIARQRSPIGELSSCFDPQHRSDFRASGRSLRHGARHSCLRRCVATIPHFLSKVERRAAPAAHSRRLRKAPACSFARPLSHCGSSRRGGERRRPLAPASRGHERRRRNVP